MKNSPQVRPYPYEVEDGVRKIAQQRGFAQCVPPLPDSLPDQVRAVYSGVVRSVYNPIRKYVGRLERDLTSRRVDLVLPNGDREVRFF